MRPPSRPLKLDAKSSDPLLGLVRSQYSPPMPYTMAGTMFNGFTTVPRLSRGCLAAVQQTERSGPPPRDVIGDVTSFSLPLQIARPFPYTSCSTLTRAPCHVHQRGCDVHLRAGVALTDTPLLRSN